MTKELFRFEYHVETSPINIFPMYFYIWVNWDEAYIIHDDLMAQENVIGGIFAKVEVIE